MKFKLSILLLIIIIICNPACSEEIGNIFPVTGNPVIHSVPEIIVTGTTLVNLKDRISTGKGTSAKIVFNDGSIITMKENTEISLHRSFIKIKRGNSIFKMHKLGKKFKIYSPSLVVGIYGTEFILDVSTSGDTMVSLQTGKIKVSAIYGNKKSCFLNPGQSVIGTKKGLLEVYKTKLVLNIGTKDSSITSEQFEEIETGDEELENMESTGDLFFYDMIFRNTETKDRIDLSWCLKVNGYNELNGKKLESLSGEKVVINKLEPGYYDLTLIISGLEHTFPFELNSENSGSTLKLFLHRDIYKLYIGDMLIRIQTEEIEKHVKVFATSNGHRNRIYFKANDPKNEFTGFHVDVYQGYKLYFYSLVEAEQPSLMEFYYDGKVETGKKYIKLVPIKYAADHKIKF
ncbi:FecR domain-containing protein [bacterium]|nr:FecR domain-containing protein [bacterium]